MHHFLSQREGMHVLGALLDGFFHCKIDQVTLPKDLVSKVCARETAITERDQSNIPASVLLQRSFLTVRV
jgi:hypothetical protein